MQADWNDRERTSSGQAECIVCREEDARARGVSLAQLVNTTAAARPGADIALLVADAAPPDGWILRLQECVADESTAATASALPGPLLADAPASEELMRLSSALLPNGIGHPRLALAGGACVYVTRRAFDLLGGFDEAMPTSAGALADFGLRASARGLTNLLAGDLFVRPPSGAQLPMQESSKLAARYGALWEAALDPPPAAVERSLRLASTVGRPLSVTIDARALGTQPGGTQAYTLGLMRALAATGEVEIRALVGPGPDARHQAEGAGVASVLTYEEALAQPRASDLVHRPQQVFTVDDLGLLQPLGRRLVVSHLDLIAYHNPSYFPGHSEWLRHVRATRIAFDAADHVLFFSTHSLRDAEREDLVDSRRASVVPLGVDPDEHARVSPQRPNRLAVRAEPFLLCIGADYQHKNRAFALELVAELRRTYEWPGFLVLAGAHVEHGSSASVEREMLEARPELQDAVIDLGPVSAGERRWLMEHARALLYPTVLEGFGLVPFEAAAAGVPCLYAAQSSLAELLPAEHAVLDGWDVRGCAARTFDLLGDERARVAHVAALREASAPYGWAECALKTILAYRRALASPLRSSAREAWNAVAREQEILRLDREYRILRATHLDLLENIGEDGMALVGPHGLLSAEDKRTLLSVAVRPALRRPLFAAGRVGYRLAHRDKADASADPSARR